MPKKTNPLTQKSGLSTNILLTVVVVVIAVLVIGGILLFNRGGGANGDTVSSEVLNPPNANKILDSQDDKVVVTEFLDYQCPACYQYYRGLTKQIEQEYEGRITFVARNKPMEQAHPLARPAAQAAEAAAMQGKFREMYHQLFDNYQSWAIGANGKPSGDTARANQQFTQFAQDIGLDMQRFNSDRRSDQVDQRIDDDVADSEQAQVTGTPTLFINGERFEPQAQNFQQLKQSFSDRLDQELQQ
ncbi:DsbA family protein [Bounagaea algeriensis]